MQPSLDLYRIFFTVAECSSISVAAEKLYLTQPAVSQAVKRLEDSVGSPLFSRNSRGVKLTAEGRIFFEHIQQAMKEISRGEEMLRKLQQHDHGAVSLGVSSTLFKHILIPRLRSFIREYPHLEINVVNRTSAESLSLIDEGKIDLCIISKPLDIENYHFNELAEIQDIFVSSPAYLEALGQQDPLTCGRFIFMEKGNVTREYVEKHLTERQISIKPALAFSNMDFLIEFAKISMGIAAVIKDFVTQELTEGSLCELTHLPTIPKRSVCVAYHKRLPLSLAAQAFLEHLLHSAH
ncbi:MAG: LysR family transcriptional regulator [Peptococcaceae bacterium]|jgi:DNA-binding transcriptional LysR family regulator|nr:LysR family transcriptional regulator [Peptococcaceae bacterium]